MRQPSLLPNRHAKGGPSPCEERAAKRANGGGHTARLERSARILTLALTLISLCAQSALAFDGETADTSNRKTRSILSDELLDIELPLHFRAGLATRYLSHAHESDALASRFLANVGPRIQTFEVLETRVTLSRSISPNIDLGVEWRTQNRLVTRDPMGMGTQFVGAMIRISR